MRSSYDSNREEYIACLEKANENLKKQNQELLDLLMRGENDREEWKLQSIVAGMFDKKESA